MKNNGKLLWGKRKFTEVAEVHLLKVPVLLNYEMDDDTLLKLTSWELRYLLEIYYPKHTKIRQKVVIHHLYGNAYIYLFLE